jgi:hypothetical protein
VRIVKKTWVKVALSLCLSGLSFGANAAGLPPDVRSNHWAAHAVEEALTNGVLSPQSDGQFHGEARVTRGQAVIALSKLARAVEQGKWRASKSRPVPASVAPVLAKGAWKQRPVTRYMFAALLARFGDYLTNGITRAPANSRDTGKSEAFPPKPTIKLAASHPAYAALTYMAAEHMIWPGSPLLAADSQPVKGMEVSRGLAEMSAGLNDRLTELGHDAEGNTPDPSFHSNAPAKKN